MRDLVKLYFKDKDIVNHHVESFNDFLATVHDSDKAGTDKIVSEPTACPSSTTTR